MGALIGLYLCVRGVLTAHKLLRNLRFGIVAEALKQCFNEVHNLAGVTCGASSLGAANNLLWHSRAP
jgi:hypothetical protein